MRTQVYIAIRINILDETIGRELIAELKEISRMLQGLSLSIKEKSK